MKKKLDYQKYFEWQQKYQLMVSRIASVRLIVFFVMFLSFILKYYYYPVFLNIVFLFSLICFIILIYLHDKYYKLYDYYSKCVSVIQSFIDRENGEWKKFQDDGSDFLEESCYYYQDLDIFGKNSLYQYLCLCKTKGGRVKLRDRLSNREYAKSQLQVEQDAVKDISEHISFLISFVAELSYYDDKDVDLVSDFSFHKEKKKGIGKGFIIAIICSLFSCLLFVCSLIGILNVYYFYGVFLLNYFISVIYVYFFREEFSFIERVLTDYRGVYPLFKRCIVEDFSSSKLKNMQKNMELSLKYGESLKRLDSLNSLRNNVIASFFLNGFFCINLVLVDAFSYFISKNLHLVKKGVSDIEELESICSLATIGICSSYTCIPSRVDDVFVHAVDMVHPLLGSSCVSNSFSSKSGVNIITGSNMGGKTSFLRTLGINLILMNSGGFVCAREFSSCYFKIFTSMRVLDDISRGISTFYGELLRIKDMIEYVDCGNMLVLIDEIFKGTNYQDRIYGAKEVIKRLNTDKTIVLLTTHDFELCEERNVCNYYVKEEYVNHQIVFDYKIRKGKCVSTNARYLMMEMGIIDKKISGD